MTDHANLSTWIWRQAWLPLAIRKLAYKQLSKQKEAPDYPFTCDFYGLQYQGNLRNGIEFAIYFYGAFEKPLLHFLRDAMRALRPESGVFCDIGANIGQHSLFMSQCCAHVHAFEPLAAVSDRLKQQIALNNLSNITIHELGLSDSNGKLPFYAPTGSNQGVGSFDADSQTRGNQPIGELEIARGDDYMAALAINQIDIMKIDVEGFEQKAIDGLRETLRRTRPVIALEVTYGDAHSFPSQQALLDALPVNYALYIFDTRKANGKTARRRGAKAKRTGHYELQPLQQWRSQDQDDLVAIPHELLAQIPLSNK